MTYRTDTPRAEPWCEIDWLLVALLLVAVAGLLVAVPLLMDWAATWQPRPAACEGLSAETCILLAQEGRL